MTFSSLLILPTTLYASLLLYPILLTVIVLDLPNTSLALKVKIVGVSFVNFCDTPSTNTSQLQELFLR